MKTLNLECEMGKVDVTGGIVYIGLKFDVDDCPLENTIMLREKHVIELTKYLVAWLNRPEEDRKP